MQGGSFYPKPGGSITRNRAVRLSPDAPNRGNCGQLAMSAVIIAPVRQQRPDNASISIRVRNGRNVWVASLRQASEPSFRLIRAPASIKKARSCPMDQKPTQICIAALTNPQQAIFATGRVLARHEAQPRSNLSATFERPCIVSWIRQSDARGLGHAEIQVL